MKRRLTSFQAATLAMVAVLAGCAKLKQALGGDDRGSPTEQKGLVTRSGRDATAWAATCDELAPSEVYLMGTVPSWSGAGAVDLAIAPAERAAAICYRFNTDAAPVIRQNRSLVYKRLHESKLAALVADDIHSKDWATNDENLADPCPGQRLREIFSAPDRNDVIARCEEHYYRVTAATSVEIAELSGQALRSVGAGGVFWTGAGLVLPDGKTLKVMDGAAISREIAVRSHGTGFRHAVQPEGAANFQLRKVGRDGSVTLEGTYGDPPAGFDASRIVSAALDGDGDLYMIGWLVDVHSIIEFKLNAPSRVVVKWRDAKDRYGIMLNDWQLLTGP